MYDVTQREKFVMATVKDLIKHLERLPPEAEVNICGDCIFYIHVEKNKSVVCLDTEDLDVDYVEDIETDPEDYWANRKKLGGY